MSCRDQVKLGEEREANGKLQRELLESRTCETRLLREREVQDLRLARLESELRTSQVRWGAACCVGERDGVGSSSLRLAMSPTCESADVHPV